LQSPNVSSCSVQLVGQLSHFTWITDDELMIYAYDVFDSRSLRLHLNSWSSLIPVIKTAKIFAKSVKVSKTFVSSLLTKKPYRSLGIMASRDANGVPCYMRVKNSQARPLELKLPPSDGHPSLSRNPDQPILISDTYPNIHHQRLLFSIDFSSHTILYKSLLVEFRPQYIPVYNWVNRHSKIPRFANFSLSSQSFTRSGLHCDLHPFFNEDSRKFGYHSSEDGYRTVRMQEL